MGEEEEGGEGVGVEGEGGVDERVQEGEFELDDAHTRSLPVGQEGDGLVLADMSSRWATLGHVLRPLRRGNPENETQIKDTSHGDTDISAMFTVWNGAKDGVCFGTGLRRRRSSAAKISYSRRAS